MKVGQRDHTGTEYPEWFHLLHPSVLRRVRPTTPRLRVWVQRVVTPYVEPTHVHLVPFPSALRFERVVVVLTSVYYVQTSSFPFSHPHPWLGTVRR